jgi:hypothetical protein
MNSTHDDYLRFRNAWSAFTGFDIEDFGDGGDDAAWELHKFLSSGREPQTPREIRAIAAFRRGVNRTCPGSSGYTGADVPSDAKTNHLYRSPMDLKSAPTMDN